MAAYPVGDSIGRTLANRRSWAGNGSADAPTPPTGNHDEPRTRRWVAEERARRARWATQRHRGAPASCWGSCTWRAR
jgi:hypothetical protein